MAKRKTNSHAGKLLSRYIRIIAEEESEMITADGEDRMATKAEAMARKMWKIALGWVEQIIPGDGAMPYEVEHAPDLKMMALLYDRMEGRAQAATEDDTNRPSAAMKVTEQSKSRIAQAGELTDG
jgi:hypothetical protein